MKDSLKIINTQTPCGKVTFLPMNIEVPLFKSDLKGSLLHFAWRNKIKIPSSCGGGGSCGTCRVFVRSALEKIESRNEIEQSMANDRQFSSEERLSCQISPVDGLVVEVAGFMVQSKSDL